MNRLVCLGWISKPERKEGSTTQNPAQTPTALLDIVTARLSHNCNFELILRPRNAFCRCLAFELIQPRLQPLELNIEVGGRNNLGEIDCQSNVAGRVRSSDDAVILVDERPKRQD